MKDILTSPRIENMKREKRSRRKRLSILLFILLASIIYALAYFSSNHRVTINNIKVTGTHIIDMTDVQSIANKELSGKYWRLFSRSNIFIYPHSRIYDNLLVLFPRIEKLTITRENWNTLHIDIAERAGSYLYCGESVPEVESNIGENCYFVNSDGYIFDKAPYFSGNIYLKYYAPIPNISTDGPLGLQMIEPERFHTLVRFVDGINALGFKPTYFVMSKDDNRLYLNHNTGDTNPNILFKDTNNLETILENLSLSMNKIEFANEIKSKYTTLLYIDLRFDNKVVYKFNE